MHTFLPQAVPQEIAMRICEKCEKRRLADISAHISDTWRINSAERDISLFLLLSPFHSFHIRLRNVKKITQKLLKSYTITANQYHKG